MSDFMERFNLIKSNLKSIKDLFAKQLNLKTQTQEQININKMLVISNNVYLYNDQCFKGSFQKVIKLYKIIYKLDFLINEQ